MYSNHDLPPLMTSPDKGQYVVCTLLLICTYQSFNTNLYRRYYDIIVNQFEEEIEKDERGWKREIGGKG